MEHHKRNADGRWRAGRRKAVVAQSLTVLHREPQNHIGWRPACGLEAQPETQRFTANPESVTQCTEAWPSRSDTSARPLGTLWGVSTHALRSRSFASCRPGWLRYISRDGR